jgi:transposase InsO family protein
MSRKGCSADNAAVEGFFSRVKNEFFHERDFDKCGTKKFMKLLNEYILWYNDDRIMLGLDGGMSPMKYRKKFGLDLTV